MFRCPVIWLIVAIAYSLRPALSRSSRRLAEGDPTSQPSAVPSSTPTIIPTRQPSNMPSSWPTAQPSSMPSPQPIAQPSMVPTQPTSQPTGGPSAQSTVTPSSSPSSQPSSVPTQPTGQPSSAPSSSPSTQPTTVPSSQPSLAPSSLPSAQPTIMPSSQPSSQPTTVPTTQPSSEPTQPTSQPSVAPTSQPSSQPISAPTLFPSSIPSASPSSQPSNYPTNQPSVQPSSRPSTQPSSVPSSVPSTQPSSEPTQPTTQPSSCPTVQPSVQPSGTPSQAPSSEPSMQPSGQPSVQPSCVPSSIPSVIPTMQPSSFPSGQPTQQPSGIPSQQPTSKPSGQPTSQPSSQPSIQPTGQPSMHPSAQPSSHPSSQPSTQPSVQPSDQPTAQPSRLPTSQPTISPSVQPTSQPTVQPTSTPTLQPSQSPSGQPSSQPSKSPSTQPTTQPTNQPSIIPSNQPTGQPSIQPTGIPTCQPTTKPTIQPSTQPSMQPSVQPTSQPTSLPSRQPTITPTGQPSIQPTSKPSSQPSGTPTMQPSSQPTAQPTSQPSIQPTEQPTEKPSMQPTSQPSVQPSSNPSCQPSNQPTMQPTSQPTAQPSMQPSSQPSAQPTSQPSTQPSAQPTGQPSMQPTSQPSAQPTIQPSRPPTSQPSLLPTMQPTVQPTEQPSSQPSVDPTGQPSCHPSAQPSSQPSGQPTILPTSQPSSYPSSYPSTQPTNQPSNRPSTRPTSLPSGQPTTQPTLRPSMQPSGQPSTQPNAFPSSHPSSQPSARPTVQPTNQPISGPSSSPTGQPSVYPSSRPSQVPTSQPTSYPSLQPLSLPSSQPTSGPSSEPSGQPSSQPSVQPTSRPTTPAPSFAPTFSPTAAPTFVPSFNPTTAAPTPQPGDPTLSPTVSPTRLPTPEPSHFPTFSPTVAPTFNKDAPLSTRYRVNVTSTTITVAVTFNETAILAGSLYCAALPNNTIINSTVDVVVNGVSTTYTAGAAGGVTTVSGLAAVTDYDVYCVAVTVEGIESNFEDVVAGKQDARTACCNSITFTNAPSFVFGDVDSYGSRLQSLYVFTYQLAAAPQDSLTVTAELFLNDVAVNETNGEIIPASKTFSSDTPNDVTGSFIISTGDELFGKQVEVALVLNGPSSVDYFNENVFVDIVGDNSAQPAPSLTRAKFSNGGGIIFIFFSAATDQAGLESIFSCDSLFNFKGIESTSCSWSNSSVVRASFVAVDDEVSLVELDDEILLLGGLVRAECDNTERNCTDNEVARNQSVTLAAPDIPIVPGVVLEVATTTSECDDVEIVTSQSTGSGGRPWSSVSWTVTGTTVTDDVDTSNVTAVLESFGVGIDVVTLPLDVVRSGVTYVVGLTVTNFLGESSSGSAAFTRASSVNVPSVSILGQSLVTIKPSQSLVINTRVTRASCLVNGGSLSYEWSISEDGVVLTDENLLTRSRDPSSYTLPAFSLAGGSIYTATLTVTAAATSTDAAATGSASVTVVVENGEVVALIDGGSSRTVSPVGNVTLSAASSYDENVGSSSESTLSFKWSCSFQSISNFGASCDGDLVGINLNSDVLSFPSLLLDLLMEYRFTVTVTAPDGRSDGTFTTLRYSDTNSTTTTDIIAAPLRVNEGQRIVVTGSVSADGYGLDCEWTAYVDGILISRLSTLAVTSIFETFSDAGSVVEFPLSTRSTGFTGGSIVTFRLTARLAGSIETFESFAEVEVEINSPPNGGSISVTPDVGNALETTFTTRTTGWSDDPTDFPLSFTFFFKQSADTPDATLQTRKASNTIATTLPAGLESSDFIITVFCSVFDQALASSTIFTSVTVNVNENLALNDINAFATANLNDSILSGDGNLASQTVNNVAATLGLANCSAVEGSFCANLNRANCSSTTGTCSSCLPGFAGFVGDANTLSVNEIGSVCLKDSECVSGNCTNGICTESILSCPSDDPLRICSGFGTCEYSDSSGSILDKVCFLSDTACQAKCNCFDGRGGADCTLSTEDLAIVDSTRGTLCESISFIASVSDPSAQILETLSSSLLNAFDPDEVLSVDSRASAENALRVVADLAAEGNLIGSSEGAAATLLDAVSEFVQPANDSSGSNGTVIDDVVSDVLEGFLVAMVNGESTEVASENVRMRATKVRSSELLQLVPPQTANELLVGAGSSSLQFADGVASFFDNGDGYVSVGITQWGVNPFSGATALKASTLRFESFFSGDNGLRMRRAVKQRKLQSSGSDFFIVLQFNEVQNFDFSVSIDEAKRQQLTNFTFPECVLFDGDEYRSCDGCSVDSYTNTNVSFACSDISLLVSASARRLQEDDDGEFEEAETEGQIQYSALFEGVLDQLSSTLSQNPFKFDLDQATPVIVFCSILVVVIVCGYILFSRWDTNDRGFLIYAYRETNRVRFQEQHERMLDLLKKHHVEEWNALKTQKSMPITSTLMNIPLLTVEGSSKKTGFWFDKKNMDKPKKQLSLAEHFTKREKMEGDVFNMLNEPKDEFVDVDALYVKNVVADFIDAVMPEGALINSKRTTMGEFWYTIASQHDYFAMLFDSSLRNTRVVRWTRAVITVLLSLFIDTLFFGIFFPDTGDCEAFESKGDCIDETNAATGQSLCRWRVDDNLSQEGSCELNPPPDEFEFIIIIVMMTIVVAIPIEFMYDFVLMRFCTRRPDLQKWGLFTEAWLGLKSQDVNHDDHDTEEVINKLFNAADEKHVIRTNSSENDEFVHPSISRSISRGISHSASRRLMHPLSRTMSRTHSVTHFHDFASSSLDGSTDAHSTFHHPSQSDSASIGGSSSNNNYDDVHHAKNQLIAQNIYENFASSIAEADRLIVRIVDFLSSNIHAAAIPWQMSKDALERQAKAQAIEHQYDIYPDGRPVPLGLFEWLRYGTPRQRLIAKIERARRQSNDIVEAMKELGDSDSHSRDVMLLQYFVLEQFSLFKRYYLNWHLFRFSLASPPLLHPVIWSGAWMLMILSQVFFLYWIFAWGASQGGVTLEEWGINFGIAVVQDIFVIQVFRVYLIFFMAMQSIKPQLKHIYRVLNRVAVAYVQDELNVVDDLAIVQHVSPACRASHLHSCKDLVTAKILHHLNDLDISECRREYSMRLSILAMFVIVVPLLAAIIDEGVADAILEQVIPGLFTFFLVANYQIWINAGFLIVLPYLVLIALYLWRSKFRKKAKKINQKNETLNTTDANIAAIRKWRVRRHVFVAKDQRMQWRKAYFYILRMVFESLLEYALLLSRYVNCRGWIDIYIFGLDPSEATTSLWGTMNLPVFLQGRYISDVIDMNGNGASNSVFGSFFNDASFSDGDGIIREYSKNSTNAQRVSFFKKEITRTEFGKDHPASFSSDWEEQQFLINRIPPQVRVMARKEGVDSLASWQIRDDSNVQSKDYLTRLLLTRILDFNPHDARAAFESSNVPDIMLSSIFADINDIGEELRSPSHLSPSSRTFEYDLFCSSNDSAVAGYSNRVYRESAALPELLVEEEEEDDTYYDRLVENRASNNVQDTATTAGADPTPSLLFPTDDLPQQSNATIDGSNDTRDGHPMIIIADLSPLEGLRSTIDQPIEDRGDPLHEWDRMDTNSELQHSASGCAEGAISVDSTGGPSLLLTELQTHETQQPISSLPSAYGFFTEATDANSEKESKKD